ncbi:xanthine dehydrogenase family protein molybdopterin-binding subunit [Ginsengibacter hankyongi]|uniref:Xanthine dehydrogenase family protein molybdopterin-binding subunit n=1 Tax=Ginsengibacter hankyongi TaxID=2607284 RepID=A0A5J5ICX7_9BACT|nr:molybdopterin cofactor-binding domain-containing protein [Ginsengibacter hankyongi]KAA9037200.1 xanthine dehydrogenase family protein molybdopterin-binding subunit [Ginsengibacter hankyongi]
MKFSSAIPRRKFLKIAAMSGTCLALGYVSVFGEEPKIVNLDLENGNAESELNPFIYIDTDGKITLLNHRPEMGQGTFEAIPMIIAEELDVDIANINIMPSPADRGKYGDQMVVGSQSIRRNYELMRRVGASAKEMLIIAAAGKWNIAAEKCYAENAMVINRSTGAKLSYGDLVADARKLKAPDNPTLKQAKDFKIIGKSLPRRDIPAKLNGDAQFGIDIEVPGMLYASIERSPVLLGKLISFDDTKAKAVTGVKYVLKTQREVFGQVRVGLAVIADNYWAALQGRKMLEVKWDNGDLETWTTQKIKDDYIDASRKPAEVFEQKGDFDKTFNDAPVKIEASYETPYQTHAPMEPMNAIVSVKKDTCEFWGSTQNPNGMKDFLSKKYKVPQDSVKINYTLMGGAFGRRSLTDVVEEAADLSKQTGTPVKVIWTREDDLTQGPFRACSLNVCRGAINKDGNLVSLEHKVICQDIRNQSGNNSKPTDGIAGGINTEYAIPNLRINGVLRKFYIPVSYWRSVYHSTNCFAHESFIDELAYAAKKDPIDFRLSLLKNHKRYTGVLQKVAEKSNWYSPRETDTGKGVAIVERSGAFVAMVAEVKRLQGKIVPTKIIAAIDCGTPVNPDIIRAQTEGCIVMGLTSTYKSGLTIDKGKVVEQNFNTYKMLRIEESPAIEVHVIESSEQPEGAGEPGLPTVAPALTNAIFELTKKRIRALPFKLEEL